MVITAAKTANTLTNQRVPMLLNLISISMPVCQLLCVIISYILLLQSYMNAFGVRDILFAV
jgi:hypothetical protein